mmetsp:Transcript_48966/g.153814  ORF Transcript_48966/g.153814 Transcript_48966/m.153814 type:complete len:291 (-) Transcript_48966:60-932(-)
MAMHTLIPSQKTCVAPPHAESTRRGRTGGNGAHADSGKSGEAVARTRGLSLPRRISRRFRLAPRQLGTQPLFVIVEGESCRLGCLPCRLARLCPLEKLLLGADALVEVFAPLPGERALLDEADHAENVVFEAVEKGADGEEAGRLLGFDHRRTHKHLVSLAVREMRHSDRARTYPLPVHPHGTGATLALSALVLDELASLRRHGRERLSHRGHRAERFVALRKLDWNGARQPDGARTQVAGSPSLLRERCAAGPVLHARVARAQCFTGRRSKRGDRSQRGDDRRGASRER